ncbi:MAG: NAD-glutamate dehydrogenase [Pseudomonadota bacterium]
MSVSPAAPTMATELPALDSDYGRAVGEVLKNAADPDPSLGDFALALWRNTPREQRRERSLASDAALTRETFELFHRADSESRVAVSVDTETERTRFVLRHPDMPFLVDSALMVLSERELPLLYLHNAVVTAPNEETTKASLIAMETLELDTKEAEELCAELTRVLQQVSDCVNDYAAMRAALADVRSRVSATQSPEHKEAAAFLEWLGDDHFTFLGYRRFDFSNGTVDQVPESALGTLRRRRPASRRALSDLSDDARQFLLEPSVLSFSKAGTKSQVHRPAYPDYVGIKRFDEQGHVVGEDGFLGLYTSRVYRDAPETIPVIRQRVHRVLDRSAFSPGSFDFKGLATVLATYPRDELFQSSDEDLFRNAVSIAHLHERRETRAYLTRGRYGMFYSCMVYLPRDALNTRVRTAIRDLLFERLQALDVEFTPFFSESILVRLQYIVRVDPQNTQGIDATALEAEIRALAPDWRGDFVNAVHGKSFPHSELITHEDFPEPPLSYQERFDVQTAIYDLGHLLRLNDDRDLILRFYRAAGRSESQVNLKVFKLGDALPLSELVPILEHFGFKVLSEQPYRLPTATHCFNIQDFSLARESAIDLEAVGPVFEDAFRAVWGGQAESDRLNGLIVSELLTWREVALLRSYARYMKQAAFGIEQSFIAMTLLKYPAAARLLVDCFTERLDPAAFPGTAAAEFTQWLDTLSLINEDRVFRHLFELIEATVRSNYFRTDLADPETIAHKIAASELSSLPQPRPLFEIFVYSPSLEGVHLRSSRVARGGIRWSDRLEDFRTEVLGLVKAQIVKNAVIVPSGAKGGFVVKAAPADSRDAWLAQGQDAYRAFIRSLLSITDNLVEGRIVPPPSVARLDRDDPYLVVAADKGTATFSDIANEIALEAGFWLGDAFASGGSVGYDHKKLGITARGAWVSVQRHFRRLGVDVQSEPIRTLGIGDMSGDVFGNGMLRSRHIALVAAFNHLHLFIEPEPNCERAFLERERLFALPRSGWGDYDAALISHGGGVFARTQKSITITPEMKTAFGIDEAALAPDELIARLLEAPLDLIWNGGIGTYVKASSESNESVGDRANDALRRNANRLRARVVGEGGNLGLTHRARLEFAAGGGLINADFIDNAGGVDCSDHEVNLKILLSAAVARGELSGQARDELLLSQADAVADLVLENNFVQARCLALASAHSEGRVDEYNRLAQRLERALDFSRQEADFPDDEQLVERARSGARLLLPELSTLLGYGKILLKQQLDGAQLAEDPIIGNALASAFPEALATQFAADLPDHRLREEIVVTQVTNEVVGNAGITFVNRIMEFVGCSAADVVRGYWVVADLFDFGKRMAWYDGLSAEHEQRVSGQLDLVRFVRRATRWLIRHHRGRLLTAELIERYAANVRALLKEPELLFLTDEQSQTYLARREQLGTAGRELAAAALGFELFGALAVSEAAAYAQVPVTRAGPVFQALGRALDFDRLSTYLTRMNPDSHWHAMERDALLDDLCNKQLDLTCSVLAMDTTVEVWLQNHQQFVVDWQVVLADLPSDPDEQFSALAMTVRKLMDLGSFG